MPKGGKKEKILRNEKIFLDNCDHALSLLISYAEKFESTE